MQEEYRTTRPSMIVVPSRSVQFWENELSFWGNNGVDGLVVYAGTAAARAVLEEHELWLQPSSMDSKSTSSNSLPSKAC